MCYFVLFLATSRVDGDLSTGGNRQLISGVHTEYCRFPFPPNTEGSHLK